MNFQQCMETTIEYIEANICGVIDYEKVEKKACCSLFHFQRVFSYVLGIPLAEYIRCRRMSMAVGDLRNTEMRICDIAVKYGYESQSSFSRAFQAFHGVTPTEARREETVVKVFPKMYIEVKMPEMKFIDYRIEDWKHKYLIGKSIFFPASDKEDFIFEQAFLFGNEILKNGMHDKINKIGGKKPGNYLLGVRFTLDPSKEEQFMYAVDLEEYDHNSNEFTVFEVNQTSFAVFTYEYVVYPKTTLPMYKHIYTQWFPETGFTQAEGPCIERVRQDLIEIMIPIKNLRG